MFDRLTGIPVGAGDALSVVEGFAKIFNKNEKSRKPARPVLKLQHIRWLMKYSSRLNDVLLVCRVCRLGYLG